MPVSAFNNVADAVDCNGLKQRNILSLRLGATVISHRKIYTQSENKNPPHGREIRNTGDLILYKQIKKVMCLHYFHSSPLN